MTESVEQVGPPYASREFLFAVSRSGHVSGGIIPCLKTCEE